MLDKQTLSLIVVIIVLVVLYVAYKYSSAGAGSENLAGRILPDPKHSSYGIIRN
ncbi:proliferating cell nuclear antigen [Faustovirus]|nr:hypothetical protein F-LCD7_0409 [Faustovirus]QJX72177.1 hypothetical protein F-M6_0414 [Faustovirus]QJX72672.1 proliferating cell nuclear antigen [Faustovirus]QJX74182.1 hypothetical protein F-E9_429 [Faustovirus]SMH63666.1 Hypothetical protein FSTVLC9_184 [Faustovirus]